MHQPLDVQLKAIDLDPERSAARCVEIGAEDRGMRIQRDTYFRGPRGRLKVREEDGGKDYLLAYEWPSLAGRRQPRRWFFPLEQPAVVISALTDSLGVEVVVEKERRAFARKRVRIYLDEVEDIGHFIKLNALAAPGFDLLREEVEVADLRRVLEIDPADLVADSYCELVLATKGL